jgi:hypothetical protein
MVCYAAAGDTTNGDLVVVLCSPFRYDLYPKDDTSAFNTVLEYTQKLEKQLNATAAALNGTNIAFSVAIPISASTHEVRVGIIDQTSTRWLAAVRVHGGGVLWSAWTCCYIWLTPPPSPLFTHKHTHTHTGTHTRGHQYERYVPSSNYCGPSCKSYTNTGVSQVDYVNAALSVISMPAYSSLLAQHDTPTPSMFRGLSFWFWSSPNDSKVEYPKKSGNLFYPPYPSNDVVKALHAHFK